MSLLPVKRSAGEKGSLDRFHDEIDELFKDMLSGWDFPLSGRTRWPSVDIEEKEGEFIVNAEIPGCKASDIDISIHGNTLTISGEKKQEKEEKRENYYHVERSYGSFRRDLNLPSDIDADNIEAKCKDGVLSIVLPKTEKTKAIKVKVKEE